MKIAGYDFSPEALQKFGCSDVLKKIQAAVADDFAFSACRENLDKILDEVEKTGCCQVVLDESELSGEIRYFFQISNGTYYIAEDCFVGPKLNSGLLVVSLLAPVIYVSDTESS